MRRLKQRLSCTLSLGWVGIFWVFSSLKVMAIPFKCPECHQQWEDLKACPACLTPKGKDSFCLTCQTPSQRLPFFRGITQELIWGCPGCQLENPTQSVGLASFSFQETTQKKGEKIFQATRKAQPSPPDLPCHSLHPPHHPIAYAPCACIQEGVSLFSPWEQGKTRLHHLLEWKAFPADCPPSEVQTLLVWQARCEECGRLKTLRHPEGEREEDVSSSVHLTNHSSEKTQSLSLRESKRTQEVEALEKDDGVDDGVNENEEESLEPSGSHTGQSLSPGDRKKVDHFLTQVRNYHHTKRSHRYQRFLERINHWNQRMEQERTQQRHWQRKIIEME